jgi:hypothetical protein
VLSITYGGAMGVSDAIGPVIGPGPSQIFKKVYFERITLAVSIMCQNLTTGSQLQKIPIGFVYYILKVRAKFDCGDP